MEMVELLMTMQNKGWAVQLTCLCLFDKRENAMLLLPECSKILFRSAVTKGHCKEQDTSREKGSRPDLQDGELYPGVQGLRRI